MVDRIRSASAAKGLGKLADLEGRGADLVGATVAMGFSRPVARAGLEAEFEAWDETGLATIEAELETLEAARLPSSVLIIAPRTLPASTLRQCLYARAVGAEVLLKTATGQQRLAEVLASADPGIVPTPFNSGDKAALAAAIERVECVVVLGSDATIEAVRNVVPDHKGFAGYGHKVSAAWLSASPLDVELAGLAEDLCAWDQAGCLSPQTAWIESGADFGQVLGRLAEQVRRVEARLPMPLTDDVVSARYAMQTLAEMAGQVTATETALLACLVGQQHQAFRFAPGPRSLWLLPASQAAVDGLGSTLSTLGMGRVTNEARVKTPDGVRRCALGQMQRPTLAWCHDGRPNLGAMLLPNL